MTKGLVLRRLPHGSLIVFGVRVDRNQSVLKREEITLLCCVSRQVTLGILAAVALHHSLLSQSPVVIHFVPLHR